MGVDRRDAGFTPSSMAPKYSCRRIGSEPRMADGDVLL
jgi:hypothetical protein